MEPLILSSLWLAALAGLAALLTAGEREATEFTRERTPGACFNPARNWAGELQRHLVELSGWIETGSRSQRAGRVVCFVAALGCFAVVPLAPPLPGSRQPVMIAPAIDAAVPFVSALVWLFAFGRLLNPAENEDENFLSGWLTVLAALGLTAVGAARISGSWQLGAIVTAQEQAGLWWLARQPVGFAALLLCLVWLMLGISAPGENSESGTLLPHLLLIAAVYLLVVLFLGGWHVWGVESTAPAGGGTWFGWIVRTLAYHLKGAAVLAWLVWLRFVRLPTAEIAFWRRQAASAALTAALLGLLVTELVEQFLVSQPVVWKAGLAWLALMTALLAAGLFSRRLTPE